MGLLRRHDLFLDLSQPIFAKEDLRTNEERPRSEGAALHRPPGVLQEPVLDLRGLDQREEALAVQPRLLERRPQHIRVVQFLGLCPHVSELRIFTSLPNPCMWKATSTARLCGIDVEVRGTSPQERASWLWDFDARPLSRTEQVVFEREKVGKVGFQGTRLHKTSAFLAADPFGAVPAAFSPDGKTGIFELNSIMRAGARLGHGRLLLYGSNADDAARIDRFLDA